MYKRQRLLNASVAVPPGVDTRAQPFADDALRGTGPAIATTPGSDSGRVIPAPPAAAPAPVATPKTGSRASAKPRRQETAAKVATPAAISLPAPRAAAAAPAAPMIFQAEEIKPVVIDLRK